MAITPREKILKAECQNFLQEDTKAPEKGPGKFFWRRTFCPCQVNPMQFVILKLVATLRQVKPTKLNES